MLLYYETVGSTGWKVYMCMCEWASVTDSMPAFGLLALAKLYCSVSRPSESRPIAKPRRKCPSSLPACDASLTFVPLSF